LKSEDAGVYKCTTAYDECYKFRVTIDNKETKAKENKKEKKAKAKEASPTIKLFKSVNDQSKNQMTTTTDEVEYEEDYDETATTNATQAIKTTASNIDDEDEDDDQEEEITTTTPTSEVEYYYDDEPIKVTVSSGSVAELVCGDSTQYDEYIDWGRPDKVTAFILVDVF
jgi:hypothetical protein